MSLLRSKVMSKKFVLIAPTSIVILNPMSLKVDIIFFFNLSSSNGGAISVKASPSSLYRPYDCDGKLWESLSRITSPTKSQISAPWNEPMGTSNN